MESCAMSSRDGRMRYVTRDASLLSFEHLPGLDATRVIQRALVRVGAQAGDTLAPQVVVHEVLLRHTPQLTRNIAALPDLEGLVNSCTNLMNRVVPRVGPVAINAADGQLILKLLRGLLIREDDHVRERHGRPA
eukprot:4063265-Pyramimonas_sp.AAC.1